ncbi:hypothetical protein [Sagittula sp. SSi028]|uniref:hypothetical protein n=1 Tax=Sagittula sp. SSi028 TaxID=3400636 RepID=UPI003AF7061C
MILTLLFGALAGWAARQYEPQITDQLSRWLGRRYVIAEQDRSVAALLVCLVAGASLLSLLGEGGRVFVYVLCAALGYFLAELRGTRG